MNKKHKKSLKRTLTALLALCFGLAFTHIQMTTVNPVTGHRELVFVSKEKEIEIGNEIYTSLQEETGGAYNDPRLNAYVNRVGKKIAAVSDRPDLPFEFVVIDSDIPNAWAAPGGKIAINVGLLQILDSEAELAAVLAHEITHATARHTAQRIERDLFLKGAHIVDLAASPFGLANSALELDGELKELKYTRDAEFEADYFGMEYLARAGYNVRAAIEVHKKLKETFQDLHHLKLAISPFLDHG